MTGKGERVGGISLFAQIPNESSQTTDVDK